ncbi:hypothetical protein O6H91_03G039500 [Diphasiastrum complanatum]|uniref:Uncharacterized protein n=1 Tax=Diphasiastrum complanatum TaxID=34168 RepID=A0ACC2E5L5_DIPCM|nr:hypothetical protein O6H91_03G039500 [Diphasiastrum complanatum]
MEEDAKEIKALQACNVLHGGPTKLEVMDDASSSGRRGSRKARRGNLLEVRTEQENKLTDFLAYPKNQSTSIQTSRMEAFAIIWENIEKVIQDTLAAQHMYIFKKLQQWVLDRQFHDAQLKLYYANAGKASIIDSCNATRSSLRQSQRMGVASNRIHTALLFVGAIDSSDSRAIFDGLTTYMKEHDCHVASLRPHNLSSKAVIHGALRSLLKQFTQHNPDTTDMEILAAWHTENSDQNSPIVIIIEDAECCNSMVLAELIIVLRDLPPTTFSAVLEEWKRLASHDEELNAEITSFQLKMANFPNYPDLEKNKKIDGIGQGGDQLGGSLASEMEGQRFLKKQAGYRSEFYVVKTMAAELLERIYRQHLIPSEALLFHEVFCFTDVNLLKQALTAETRKQIHADVLTSHDYLHCTCCSPKHGLSPSMHDTSLLYSLSQGSDNIVNIHDCYQSFYMQFSAAEQPRKSRDIKSSKRKRDLSKKTPEMFEKFLQLDKASIQARFTRSITELQIVGLFRMPTKKRPDYVHRVFSI